MSIASRITSIEEHIGDVYDTLELGGSDLTNVNKNIVNINSELKDRLKYYLANGIDVVWDNWNKVNGEGTSLTLNNTLEGKMSIVLKGNTSQYTTTGKNLLDVKNNLFGASNGIEKTYNNDGTITISGKATQTWAYVTNEINVSLSAGTYTFSITNTLEHRIYILATYNDDTTGTYIINAGNTYISFTTSQGIKKIRVSLSVMTVNTTYNETTGVMLEKNSSKTSFEPYTNGASPNPDYPQEIHTVKGDNIISICEENLYNKDDENMIYKGYINATGYILVNHNDFRCAYISCKPNTTYTISRLQGARFIVASYEKVVGGQATDNYINDNTKSVLRLTTNATAKYLVVWYYHPTQDTLTEQQIRDSLMIQEGNIQTPVYSAFSGANYPINLPVENLADKSLYTISGSYYIESINDGEITSTSLTGYQGARLDIGKDIAIPANKNLFISFKLKSSATGNNFNTLQIMNSSNASKSCTEIKKQNPTTDYQTYIYKFNQSEAFTLRRLYFQHVGNTNEVFSVKDIMISDTLTYQYYPYGTTPIEMCSIPGTNYYDTFIQTTGKNLFDGQWETGSINVNGELITDANTIRSANYIEVLPDTKYTISTENNCSIFPHYYDINKTYINYNSTQNTPKTITTPSNAYYIKIRTRQSEAITNLNLKCQFELGQTSTEYEPYGKGDWYKKGVIGKVNITGSTGTFSNPSTNRFNIDNAITDYLKSTSNTLVYLSNQYKAYKQTGDNASFNTLVASENYGFNMTSSELSSNLRIKDTRYTTTSDLQTWLNSNPLTVYYVLATPTFTKITDPTLSSQLTLLSNARSMNAQTNINQENNDEASVINATALEDM